MIYIFDDRYERRRIYGKIVESYADIVKIENMDIDNLESLDQVLFDKYSDADCIIFHGSYVFKSKGITLEKIKKFFKGYNVPFVTFSGGIEKGTYTDKYEYSANSEVMYSNLKDFLIEAKTQIRPQILLWGVNYRLNELLNIQNEIAVEYFLLNDFDRGVDMIEEVAEDICQSFKESGFVDIGNSVYVDIEKIRNEGEVKWGALRDIIQCNVDKMAYKL